jgi:hypothetical protein
MTKVNVRAADGRSGGSNRVSGGFLQISNKAASPLLCDAAKPRLIIADQSSNVQYFAPNG